MQQHPVPQHISSYEFKLVGDMTLKQFFQLAGGIVIALIFYATPLPGIIKWPFVIFFALLGTALAFLPFEERPLSTWIFAFLKAIYMPTQFIWVENGAEEVYAQSITPFTTSSIDAPLEPTTAASAESGVLAKFELAEKGFFQKITTLFNHPTPVAPSAFTVPTQKMESITPSINTNKPAALTGKPIFQIVEEEKEVISPIFQPIRVETILPEKSVQNSAQNNPTIPVNLSGQPAQEILQNLGARVAAQPASNIFSAESVSPHPPDRPNTVAGQVLSVDGKIVEGAILEIRDNTKRPVRALRTNRVGHFLTVTPLSDGDYEIDIEKEGHKFNPVSFKAEGELIAPILIKAVG